MEIREKIAAAAEAIRQSNSTIAFTGAGISVESGVPPFRGSENALWSKYDPEVLDLNYFYNHPGESWEAIKDLFYEFMFKTTIEPNMGHKVLAAMESAGMLDCVVTQNIDFLHQGAGSKRVYEFHGTAGRVVCTKDGCGYHVKPEELDMDTLPPRCPKCGALLKPDFVFFSENIPVKAYEGSMNAAKSADVVIVVGTTAQVMPAGMIPIVVKQHGGTVIEINPEASAITARYTDIYIPMKAGEAMGMLAAELGLEVK